MNQEQQVEKQIEQAMHVINEVRSMIPQRDAEHGHIAIAIGMVTAGILIASALQNSGESKNANL